MGLDLRSTPVMTKGAAASIKGAMDILADVQRSVRNMGLPEYPKPEGTAPPLGNLDSAALSNRELERYYTSYVAYAAYIGPKVAEAEAAYRISGSNLKQIAANLETQMYASKVPKAEVKAKVLNNPVWIEQELEHLKLFATKTILESHMSSYSNQAKALSRCIELRKMEFESENRANGIGAYKGPARQQGRPGSFARPTRP